VLLYKKLVVNGHCYMQYLETQVKPDGVLGAGPMPAVRVAATRAVKVTQKGLRIILA
jgi:hypothetical protein